MDRRQWKKKGFSFQATRCSPNLSDTNTSIIIRCDKKQNNNNNNISLLKQLQGTAWHGHTTDARKWQAHHHCHRVRWGNNILTATRVSILSKRKWDFLEKHYYHRMKLRYTHLHCVTVNIYAYRLCVGGPKIMCNYIKTCLSLLSLITWSFQATLISIGYNVLFLCTVDRWHRCCR